ncbi:MAG TPA: hypothetical protein VF020_20190 [Chthoniobacterales bacterium]
MPTNEVAAIAVIAPPELISPGDATEAGTDRLDLVEHRMGWVSHVLARANCGQSAVLERGGDIGP